MREFKFRAWEGKKMYYQVRCGGIFNGMATAPSTWADNFWANLTGGEYTEVMQYTGLKDSNGKEIYEGDYIHGSDALTGMPFEGYVKFGNGSFYITDDCCTRYRWMDYSVEVVGNIYENPELL